MSDGLLKDIRIAQFKAGRTRVVLDLDELSEFDASLLSNPPRLIIDIHNTDIRSTDIHSKDDQDTHNQIAHDQRAARALKQATSSTEITDEKTLQTDPHRIRLTTLTNFSSAKATAEKPVRRNTVVVRNGVKKTIVDADDEQPPIKRVQRACSKRYRSKRQEHRSQARHPRHQPRKAGPRKTDPLKLDPEKTKPASTIPAATAS